MLSGILQARVAHLLLELGYLEVFSQVFPDAVAEAGFRPFRPALSESFCQARFRRNREIFRWKQSDP